ncbi:MAG: hypothetical protein GF398_21335 [Chitinivibrionales bacterium]|nr:hypothetical protein [Chitinivibrionales bacterium]
MRVLIYHTGALGDFVTTLPALACFKKAHPQSILTCLTKATHGKLGIDTGIVAHYLDIDKAQWAGLFADAPSPYLRDRLAEYAAALAFADESSPVTANLRASINGPILHQPPFPADQSHIVNYHLNLVRSPDKPGGEPPPIFTRGHFRTLPEGLHEIDPAQAVCIHPGSGSRAKNWPLVRFLALSERIASRGFTPVWLAGPAEKNLNMLSHKQLVVRTDLSALTALLLRARLYIGNDSGVTHLAALCGCPTIALFEIGNKAVWHPRGRMVKVITACDHSRATTSGIAAITVDEVCAAGINLLKS